MPQILLPPGHKLKRGVAARKGPVAWNQPSDGSWMEFGAYNRVRPFFLASWAVRQWRWNSHRDGAYEEGTATLEWMSEMEAEKDWRKVQGAKVDALEQIADELTEYALYHMGKGGIQPFGSRSPYPPKAALFAKAAGEMIRCITICRLRMAETETAGYRQKRRADALSAAIDTAEAERRMAEFDKKTKPNGEA